MHYFYWGNFGALYDVKNCHWLRHAEPHDVTLVLQGHECYLKLHLCVQIEKAKALFYLSSSWQEKHYKNNVKKYSRAEAIRQFCDRSFDLSKNFFRTTLGPLFRLDVILFGFLVPLQRFMSSVSPVSPPHYDSVFLCLFTFPDKPFICYYLLSSLHFSLSVSTSLFHRYTVQRTFLYHFLVPIHRNTVSQSVSLRYNVWFSIVPFVCM